MLFRSKLPLNKAEKELNQQLKQNKKWIVDEILKNANKSLVKTIFSRKVVGRSLIRLILFLTKSGVLSIKYGVKLTCLGGAFVSFYWIGKKLGGFMQYLSGEEPPPIDPETSKKLSSVSSKTLEKELIELSPQISQETQESINKVIQMSDEEKNKNVSLVLKKADELLSNMEIEDSGETNPEQSNTSDTLKKDIKLTKKFD